MLKPLITAVAVALAVPSAALAQMNHGQAMDMPMVQIADLTVANAVIRATPPNAPAAGGYIKITNAGTADDTLIAARIDGSVANMVQLHNMRMEGDVMRMYEVEGGIAIPAGESVQLAPGGLHIMIMGLAEGLTEGSTHDVTLVFEKAGEVTLPFAVLDLGVVKQITGAGGMGTMGHGAKNH